MIVNRRTGKALQASGTEDGAVVVQAAPTGEDNQLWLQEKSGKAVKLVNKASGKVLDTINGGTEAGTWTQVWQDVDGESQKWQLVKVTATYKKIENIQAGKVLDIVDMREDDGAPVQIWDDVEGLGQQWKLVAAEPAKEAAVKTEPTQTKVPARKAAAAAKAPATQAVAEEKPVKKPARKPTGTRKASAEKPAKAPRTRKTGAAKASEG